MKSEIAMSQQVAAALISGGTALAVAHLGIAGAVVAQLLATRRAFANSLALFEQEYKRQEQDRAAQTRREDSYRFADQRRSTYAKMLRSAADLYETCGSIHRAVHEWENAYQRDYGAAQDSTRTESVGESLMRGMAEGRARQAALEKPAAKLRDAYAHWERARAELDEIAEEAELLASSEVRNAAGKLAYIASTPPEFGKAWHVLDWSVFPPAARQPAAGRFEDVSESYHSARAAFLEAARRELGIVVDRDLGAGTGSSPLQMRR